MHTSASVHVSMFEPLYDVSAILTIQSSIRFDVQVQMQCRLQCYLLFGGLICEESRKHLSRGPEWTV